MGLRLSVGILLALVVGVAQAVATPRTSGVEAFTLGVSPTTGTTVFAQATDVNSSGTVVGASTGPNHEVTHAFVRQRNGIADLGTLGGEVSAALAINDRDTVVGWSATADGTFVAFAAGGRGQGQTMGALPGLADRSSAATDVNRSDTIAGWYINDAGHMRAFVFPSKQNELTDLGTLGGTMSSAFAVNDRGAVVGSSTLTGDTVQHAFLAVDGVLQDLGVLPGADSSVAYDINDRGTIVGTSFSADGTARAFVIEDGVMTPLATPPGGSSFATGINRRGWITGDIASPAGSERVPVVWIDGVPLQLSQLLPSGSPWVLREVNAISDHGVAVGSGDFVGISGFALTVGKRCAERSLSDRRSGDADVC